MMRTLPALYASAEDDPERRCAVCGDSGWEPCWELVTWRRHGPVRRERITAEDCERLAAQTEGILRREVYTSVRPCRCSSGQRYREAYQAAQGGQIEPVPVKPVRAERARWVDGKAKASGE